MTEVIKLYRAPDQDCPVVCKSNKLPNITLTGSSYSDTKIIEKHGCMEVFLFNKVLHQYNLLADKNARIRELEAMLDSANLIIEAYEDIC